MDSSLAVITSAQANQEEQERPKRGKYAPPSTVQTAGRRKAQAKASGNSNEDIAALAKASLLQTDENAGPAPRGALKLRLSSKLADFDLEVERRHQDIEAEGQNASRALEHVRITVKHIWKMQLPPLVRAMSLAELNGTYKGDISAALQKARDDKVIPQMTPLVRRSVRKNGNTVSRAASSAATAATPKTISKLSGATKSTLTDVGSPSTHATDLSQLDLLSSSVLTKFMSQTSVSDAEKSAALAALKKQIAIIEKAIPTKN